MRQEGLRSEQRGDETAEGFRWAETTAGQRRVVKCGQEGCRAECPLFIPFPPPNFSQVAEPNQSFSAAPRCHHSAAAGLLLITTLYLFLLDFVGGGGTC